MSPEADTYSERNPYADSLNPDFALVEQQAALAAGGSILSSPARARGLLTPEEKKEKEDREFRHTMALDALLDAIDDQIEAFDHYLEAQDNGLFGQSWNDFQNTPGPPTGGLGKTLFDEANRAQALSGEINSIRESMKAGGHPPVTIFDAGLDKKSLNLGGNAVIFRDEKGGMVVYDRDGAARHLDKEQTAKVEAYLKESGKTLDYGPNAALAHEMDGKLKELVRMNDARTNGIGAEFSQKYEQRRTAAHERDELVREKQSLEDFKKEGKRLDPASPEAIKLMSFQEKVDLYYRGVPTDLSQEVTAKLDADIARRRAEELAFERNLFGGIAAATTALAAPSLGSGMTLSAAGIIAEGSTRTYSDGTLKPSIMGAFALAALGLTDSAPAAGPKAAAPAASLFQPSLGNAFTV